MMHTWKIFVQFNEQKKFLCRKVLKVGENAIFLEESLALCGYLRGSGNTECGHPSPNLVILGDSWLHDRTAGASCSLWPWGSTRLSEGDVWKQTAQQFQSGARVQPEKGWAQWLFTEMVINYLKHSSVFVLSYDNQWVDPQREKVWVQSLQSVLKA